MNKLTSEQRDHWEKNGYLVIRNALSPNEVALFNSEIDRLRRVPGFEPVREQNLPIGHYGWLPHADAMNIDGWMDRRDLLPYGKHFVDLMDRPNIFDLIVDIMGPYICLSMTQAIVRPSSDSFPGYTHTDGGEALRLIRPSESSPPLAMKAMYLLTDTTERDSGNLTLFPGCHRKQIPFETDTPITPDSPGSLQILGEAGDCILFPHSMWHGPCKNRSGRARKTILYNYCQMFMRQYDFEFTPALAEWCSPRQRRLLGDLGYEFRPGSYFYGPRDQVEVIADQQSR
ncbi:MAG: phytanoyl-CoA dioxygenase family protein [Gammaproteobacteria bacterium]|nr:phytanoyl-CoA dioxygenase family protein [Gammaproteobacteria bacterium]